MADTCIVCLGDLRTPHDDDPPPEAAAAAPSDGGIKIEGDDAKTTTTSTGKSADADDEDIAHLLPCKHDLHHSCLKPWVERANSCPICRTVFNMVEVSHTVRGPVIESYPVQDKTQEAEIDPSMIVEEDELFAVEAFEPCLICGVLDDGHGAMYCDGCDKTAHIFCAGFDDAPDVWYCETCLADLQNDADLPGLASAVRRQPRARRNIANGTRAAPRRRRNNDATWARVWQEVSRRLDLDLDFPFDEEVDERQIAAQRQEFRRWQERFQVANRAGGTNRLQGIARANLRHTDGPLSRANPESQEELRAWNAFDKARESHEAPPAVRSRKRRATDSPASPSEPQQAAEQPQLKRPRLRRPPAAEQAESSAAAAARRRAEEPTFLSSLLREVETKPSSATSPATSDYVNGQYSPRHTSPAHSPGSSETGSPKATTPPPPQRPSSPPLSSSIRPAMSPMGATFSPFSPIATRDGPDQANNLRRRRRRRPTSDDADERNEASSEDHPGSQSPSRGLSYPAKEEIQRMVKLSLKPCYERKEINKDQYTAINKSVSRRLYELVHSAAALADQHEREKLQGVANDEVRKAVAAVSISVADTTTDTSD